MTTTHSASTIGLDTVADLAAQLRVDSIRSSTSAGSGHPTSSMSAADLLAVLMTRHLHYDWDEPRLPVNDHLIFSKGHASPLLYSVFKAAGVVSDDELMTGYRRFGQRLEGHPTPILPWVDVATGSLGQGLPDGVGVALAGKYLDRLPYRVWVLCGDSELAEGSIWEAFDKASYYQLPNLIAIADINRLGQRGQTDLGWDLPDYARRLEAFGARVLTVDGHDLEAIDKAMTVATDGAGSQPTVILAKTIKGKGFSEVENKNGWHGKPFPQDMADRAIAELGGVRNLVLRGPKPAAAEPGPVPDKPTTLPAPDGAGPAERDAAAVPGRREGRHQEGLRRRAGRPRRPRRPRGRAGRRGQQLDLRRRVRAGLPRPLLRDVHRRAAAGGRGHRPVGARVPRVRVHLRRLLHPRLRLHPDGRDLRRRPAAGGLARGGGDRRRRPVADGAGGPGDDAGRARLDRALPERRHQHGGAGRRDGADVRDQLPAHHPRRLTRACTRPQSSSPSAAPRSSSPARATRSRWSGRA